MTGAVFESEHVEVMLGNVEFDEDSDIILYSEVGAMVMSRNCSSSDLRHVSRHVDWLDRSKAVDKCGCAR